MKAFTDREKNLILSVHQYFLAKAKAKRDPLKRDVSSRVAECLGIGTITVGRFVAAFNKRKKPGEEPPRAADSPDSSGLIETYGDIFADVITSRNLQGLPTTARLIVSEITEKTGDTVGLSTVKRGLAAMRCSYRVGEKRDIRADSKENVAYRLQYLRSKTAGYDARGKPRKTEIYLDESYCNQHLTSGKTWLLPGMKRCLPSGKGRRVFIVGAGAIYKSCGRLRGQFVRDSVEVWVADKAATADTDYHGNFNSELFEKWFRTLCKTAQEDYDDCRFFMDGAKYHNRIDDLAAHRGKN